MRLRGLREVVRRLARGVQLPEQGQELVTEGVLDSWELAGVFGTEDAPQPLDFGVEGTSAATACQPGAQLGEGELRGLRRGGRHGQDDAGVGPGQTAVLALEGVQGGGVVLTQQRADLIGDLLPVPDRVLLSAGQHGDGLGEFGVGGQRACMSVRRMFARTRASPGSDFLRETPWRSR